MTVHPELSWAAICETQHPNSFQCKEVLLGSYKLQNGDDKIVFVLFD